jgi:hypothetical protein
MSKKPVAQAFLPVFGGTLPKDSVTPITGKNACATEITFFETLSA